MNRSEFERIVEAQSGDRLARRQALIDKFKYPYQFAEEIMRLEDGIAELWNNIESHEAEPQCRFEEHRDANGYVTHLNTIIVSDMAGDIPVGMHLQICAVCQSVHAYYPTAVGGV